MKTLGLIGGMSWESSAIYYRLINEATRARLGGLHSADLRMWSFDFAEISELQFAGDWAKASDRLVAAARGLAATGAELLLICANTMHLLAEDVEAAAPAPLLHIADATAPAIRKIGSRRPLLLGTAFTMEKGFYRARLAERHGIEALVPDADDRALVHRIIYDELCRGEVRPESRRAIAALIASMAAQGADGVILGCTELPMIVGPGDTDLPLFDTTRLHAEAAVELALVEDDANTAAPAG
jgi:aspartate racemase